MANTSPIKSIQNGLRKYKLSASAYDIRNIATSLGLDINSDTCVDPLIQHFISQHKSEPLSVLNDDEPLEKINQEQLKSLPSQQFSITTTEQKNQMVRHQAEVMAVTLSDSDIQSIAQHIDGQKTDAQELNQEIRTAISAYIQHHKNENLGNVQNMFLDIVQEQNQANQEVSEAISQGLRQFAKDIEVANNATKSSVRSALRFLAIPKNSVENQA